MNPEVERPPLFFGVSPADYERISAASHIKEFARDEVLFFEGDLVGQGILLTSGFVKITQLGTSGSQVVLKFGVPGEVLGAAALFSAAATHRSTAQAFRACRVQVWEASTFKGLVDRLPALHQNMARFLGDDLLELEERFREVATERTAIRVARQLVRLGEKIGRRLNGAVEISISREELGQMTGTTLFTVSRILSIWEGQGLVRPGRESVTICDVRSLRELSE